MKRPTKLMDKEVADNMKEVPLWDNPGNTGFLLREIVADDFMGAIGAVNSIAKLAEEADHHPDILIYGWNKVRIKLRTHDVGGLSSRDFELAKKIDELKL